MGYAEEKRQKCEIQYCVILKEGKDAGLKHYVWATKEQIKRVFDKCEFNNNGKTILDMGHIAGNNTKHGEISDKVYFDKKRLGSLVFECKNEETANKCMRYWKLREPF